MTAKDALKGILFLDIETVSEAPDWNDLGEKARELWKKKANYWVRDIESPDSSDFARIYQEKAAIYAEFGNVVVISAGILNTSGKGAPFEIKSYVGETEKQLLEKFARSLTSLQDYFSRPGAGSLSICGHNIKEFDIPYLCRRMLIRDVRIPKILNVRGKKPWEVKHLVDTMDLWKFGDLKNYVSLDLLAHVLGIESPKDDIDGSQVGRVYHEDHDLDRIRKYCEKDVLTAAQVYLRLHQAELLTEEQIAYKQPV